MIFSVGNIITLIVVIVILVIYRQLDKNNRSLEKVKKYSDKVKDELDSFVEAKMTELKDLSIDLDVHRQSVKEIFNRIGEAEEGLNSRVDKMADIQARIDDYDSALNDLAEMTSRVDENLKRLQEESEFVDTVGKRLKDAIAKTAHLEKEIPGIKEEFSQINARQLEETSKEIIGKSEEFVTALSRQIQDNEKMVNNFSDYITALEAKRDSMNADTIEAIDSTFKQYLQQAKHDADGILSEFAKDLETGYRDSKDLGEKLSGEIEDQLSVLEKRIGESERVLYEKLDEYQDRMAAVEQDYHERLKSVAQKGKGLEDEIFIQLKTHIENKAREMEKDLSGSIASTRKELEESKEDIEQLFGDTRSEVAVWKTTIEKRVTETEEAYTRKYDDFASEIDMKTRELIEEAENSRYKQEQELEGFIELTRKNMQEFQERINEQMSGLEGNVAEKEESFQRRLEDAELKNKDRANQTLDKMTSYTDGLEKKVNSVMGEIEQRISGYEGDISYRFQKLEEINGDIDSLEKTLRSAMDSVITKIKNDFHAFEKQLAEAREEDKAAAEGKMAEIRTGIEAVEQDLSELKQRAYDNVSEKLKIFEDDFFTDLRERNDTIQEQFAQWRAEINARLTNLGTEQEEARTDVEKQYGVELKERLSEFQSKTYEQLDKFEKQVATFQDGIEQRIHLSENSLQGFEESVRKELDDAKQNSRFMFEKEFTTHQTGIQEELKKFERDVDTRIRELNEDFNTGKKDILALLSSAESDVTVWQAEVLKQMQEAEAEVKDQFTDFKTETNVTVSELRENFAAQRDELIVKTQDERDRLKGEILSLGEQVNHLEEELGRKSEEAMAGFRQQSETFNSEFHQKTRDLQADLDQKVKDFRAAVLDMREKIDGAQKKMTSKIDENAKMLSVTVQEIDKKQKNFIAQTKIFERADTLKTALQQNIEDLKSQLAVVEVQSKELKEAERKFDKIKKLGDEVSAKLSRFLAEKRRVDEMEGDFKKLMNLSQAVDMKLDQVTNSHDDLQKIQAEIRQLGDLEKDVIQKYSRIEEKQKIIDTTFKGVEKNFTRLEELEGNIASIEADINNIPGQLTEITGRIEELAMNKGRADSALKSLETLETIAADVEIRMERMQKAREWLGRTETRLEQIAKQAEDQLKLLGDILKNNSKDGMKGTDGAPSNRVRNMVRQLAHQGWGVNEIAKQTQLSRGEVELILELLPK